MVTHYCFKGHSTRILLTHLDGGVRELPTFWLVEVAQNSAHALRNMPNLVHSV